ncbi:3-oxoacyl-ACP reductase FabG [Alphaproteobacteria bacterium]|nr:3-oxoacyl-ACP reductase FabG [Alphaproteobacteria bacterium]
MKKILLTGGTGGIGKSLARDFNANGYYVIVTGRNKNRFDEIDFKNPSKTDFFTCDLSIKEQLSSCLEKIIQKHPLIEILINNAGVTEDSLFLRMDLQKWQNVIDINLNTTFQITNFFLKQMVKNRWGRVINITSVVGHTGNIGQANYCASKMGIIGMSKSLALEVAKRGITINCISPGFIDTKMTQGLDENTKKLILEKIPLGKIGEPRDISNCALFIASENSNYITGQTFHVNGGLTMI